MADESMSDFTRSLMVAQMRVMRSFIEEMSETPDRDELLRLSREMEAIYERAPDSFIDEFLHKVVFPSDAGAQAADNVVPLRTVQ